MNENPLFSIITLTFNRPHYLKKLVEAVQSQTYKNLEFIIIDNAANETTQAYLKQLISESIPNFKFVRFTENQYDPKDPNEFMAICCNKALEEVQGEYHMFISDDDLIANDYVERMVNLFKENQDCISAMGQPYSIDGKGNKNTDRSYQNMRPKFMPGHKLMWEYFQDSKTPLYSSPGSIFSVKTSERRKIGGFHSEFDFTDFVALIPTGITAYDQKAEFYWRHHDDQMSSSLSKDGIVYVKSTKAVIIMQKIEKKWNAFEDGLGPSIVEILINRSLTAAANIFAMNFYYFRINSCFRTLRLVGVNFKFYKAIIKEFISQRAHLIFSLKMLCAYAFFKLMPNRIKTISFFKVPYEKLKKHSVKRP